jgi:hypothetical protein
MDSVTIHLTEAQLRKILKSPIVNNGESSAEMERAYEDAIQKAVKVSRENSSKEKAGQPVGK